MADLYSVIAGIEPDQQDIVEAELVARQILSAQFPDLDLREGTAIRDLTIRPAAFLLALCKKGMDFYFRQNVIVGIDDETDTELVDNLLGNFFLERNTGTFAVISARLYFARQKSVTLTTGTSFSTDGSLLFFPADSIVVPDGGLSYDSFQNEYYLDVNLVASGKGEQYNLSEGSLLYFSNFDPFFLHAEINFLVTKSLAAETNTDFINRAPTAISTRNLINEPSIDAKIKQDFNYVTRVDTVGAGNSYMHRDQSLVKGLKGSVRLASTSTFTNSNTRVQIGLPAHGFIEGQLLDLQESGGATNAVSVKGVAVYDVIDVDTFSVILGVTITPHIAQNFFVTAVDNDLWVHQGGCVDVYVGDELTSSEVVFTTNSTGKFTVSGPCYELVRVNGVGDTIPFGTSWTSTFAGSRTRTGITMSQDVDGTLRCKAPSHPMTLGRLVNLKGWPTAVSNLRFEVTEVVDGDNVVLGRNQPIYSPDSGLSPTLTWTDPYVDTGFSNRQEVTVSFGAGQPNKTATFLVKKIDKVVDVQNYLNLDANRVLCADMLARGFDFARINLTLVSYAENVPSTGLVASLATAYFKSLKPGQELVVSNLIAALQDGGVDSLQLPIGITSQAFSKDWFTHPGVTLTDTSNLPHANWIFHLGTVTVTAGAI